MSVGRRSEGVVGSIFERVSSLVRGDRSYDLGVTTYIKSISCPYCGGVGDALVISRVVFRRIPRIDASLGIAESSVLDGYAVNRVSCSYCGRDFYILSSALRQREKGRFTDIDVRIVKGESSFASLLEERRPFSGIVMDGVLVFKYPELLFYESYESFVEQVGGVRPAFESLKVASEEGGGRSGVERAASDGQLPGGVESVSLERRRR